MSTEKDRNQSQLPRDRGKTMTTPGGLVRKVAYLDPEEAEGLRRRAFEERRSESDMIREAVRKLLDTDD